MPKRPEIKAADFAKALDDEPLAVIPFEPQLFGTAANNGQMIAEISRPSHRPPRMFRQLAQTVDRALRSRSSSARGLLSPLIEKLLQSVTPESLELRSCLASVPVPVVPPLCERPAAAQARPSRASAAGPGVVAEGGRAPFPSAGSARRSWRAPSSKARCVRAENRPQQIPAAVDARRSESYYEVKGSDLRRTDRGDRSCRSSPSSTPIPRARKFATSSTRSSRSRTS